MGGRIENPYEVLEDILAGVVRPRDLPLALLDDITDHFSEDRKIGQGGFGAVYKCVLGSEFVAVKNIFVSKYTVDDRLFRREVDSLMRIKNHPNLVRFLGFCSNTARVVKEKTGSEETIYPQVMERLLCFEYISNGSLDKHITDELRGLTWDTRFDIIRGICEGLRYLHKDKSIIHMDLKPANILLDDHMIPKITDFGQARLAENTHTKGERFLTPGYCAPEYRIDGETSDKADIYSLGVVIVEMVTGTKHIPELTYVLRRWTHRWNKSAARHQHHQVIKCMEIAIRCRLNEPQNRPSISDIIRDLNETGSTSGSIGQTSPCQYDGMLGIEPLELRFHFEHNKQMLCSVALTNETSNSIAFNILTPSKQYITQPEKGILLPGGKCDVNMTLQSQGTATLVTNDDKFIVQSIKLKEGLADEEITDHIFNSKASEVIDEVNLMIIYEPEKYQADLSHDQQEEEVSKDIGSSSYENTGLIHFDPLESISRNLATSLTSDRTVDLATGAIGSLLPKLSELVHKYNLETSIRSDVDCVIQELTVMRADLCNVSEVQRDNSNEQIKLVKHWADKVREMSYNIEDVVDGFLMHVEGSEPATCIGWLMELLEKMMSLFTLGRTNHQIGDAIKKIKNQIQDKSVWKREYKVEKVASFEQRMVANTVSTINAHLLTALANDSKKLVGIKDVMKHFTKRLRGVDDKDPKVHSIFGIAGLGKTTLARAVYNQLTESFHLTAFVPVGRNPGVKKLFYDILFQLDQKKYIELKKSELDEIQLIDVLKSVLKNNRYLIVIDDIWDKKVWYDWIKFAFVDSKHGSKIIITTRIFEVAKISSDVYKLDPLSHGYSEELFYATLSPEGGRWQSDVTDGVIEKILSKCRGVPLAIITIANVLARKQRDDWPEVYNSIGFGPEVNEEADNTRKILLFSYSDLPRHIRTCLLHLSIFPEDKLIPKDMAIWMWVAEGFVHEERGKGLFELGERHFNQLVNRSMVQLVVNPFESVSQLDSMIYFRIHDLVLDMICSLSKHENFVTVLETDEQHTSSIKNARRLAVQNRDIKQLDPPTINCMIQLRSFYAIDCRISVMPPLSSFKVLRVLSMEGCKFNKDQPYQLEHIGKLLQLRYLGLEEMPIKELPEEIGDLLFLQTLILKRIFIKLPHSIGMLRQVKRLHVEYAEVPDWLVDMTSIEDLSLLGVQLPLLFAEGLSKLKELRYLQIAGADDWKRALVKSIGNLLNLQSLNIKYFLGSAHEVWEGFVPPRHLHSMTMYVSFSSVPPWMNSTHLPSLSYLDLQLYNMEARCLEILGKFPELHTLILHTVETTNEGWLAVTGSGAFPKLRHFSCSGTMLMFQRGVMPRLEYLELTRNVLALKKANFDCDFSSLGNLPSLQKLSVQRDVLRTADLEYEKRMEAAVKHALDRHPHRRPILHWS
ncbi:unnamed protein product [Alopecurus aequalis]